jgi:competence protein ComEC
MLRFRRPLSRKIALLVPASAILLWLGVTRYTHFDRDSLTLTCLDVGHGQAMFLRFPGGKTILLDAGSLDRTDIGRRVIAPYLNYCAINKIDAVIISHKDIDHINAISEVVRSSKVGAIYAHNMFVSAHPPTEVSLLAQSLEENGHRISPLDTRTLTSKAVSLEVIWPTDSALADPSLSENDKSLVLLVTFAGKTILLTSDIERSAQNKILRLLPNLKANILILPHHGSAKTTDPAFVEELNPQLAICSSGPAAYQNHRIIAPLPHIAFLCTATDGAVNVTIAKDGRISMQRLSPPPVGQVQP